MIYFVIVIIVVIIFDIVYQKNIKSKKDVIFYGICIVIALSLAIYYYSDTFRNGIAEHILRIFNLQGGT